MRQSITDRIEEIARHTPDKQAIIFHRVSSINYRQLSDSFKSIKESIASVGIKPWHRIANISNGALGYAMLEIPLMESSVYSPIDSSISPEKLSNLLELLNIDYIITDRNEKELMEQAISLNIGVFLYSIHIEAGNLSIDIELIKSSKREKRTELLGDKCLIVTTSGTTSRPKVVPLSYEKLRNSVDLNAKHYGLDANTVTLLIVPKHSYLFITAINMTLMNKGIVILLERFNSKDVYEAINEYPVTWFTSAPTVLNSLYEYLDTYNLSVSSDTLKFIRTTGAPLSKNLKEKLESKLGVPIVQLYGMTEVAGITSTFNLPKGYKEGSAGVTFGLTFKIQDHEILVSGPTVFDGYEGDDSINSVSFIDGWFRTGDIGYMDEDGYLFITGRIKELINKGGEKVSPYEIESLILKNNKVKEAAAFPYPDGYGTDDIGAAIVLKEDENIDLKTLRKFLEKYINHYKLPSRLYIIDHIPVGENNKIQRNRLFDELEKNISSCVVYDIKDTMKIVKPETIKVIDITGKVIDIFKRALKKDYVNEDEDFFELGGDSLAAVAVLSEIETEFNTQVPINIIFEKRTVNALVKYIEELEKPFKDLRYLMAIKTTGNKTPVICLHTGDGEAVTYHNIGRYLEEDRPVFSYRFLMDKGEWDHPVTFEQLCTRYVDELLSIYPEGPYIILGGCYGGILALNLATVLKERGKDVQSVVMIDSPWIKTFESLESSINPGAYRKKLLSISFSQLKNLNSSDIAPFIVKKTKSLIKLNWESVKYALYKLAVRYKVDLLLDVLGKKAVLRKAITLYKPKYYDGTVHYFRATLNVDNEFNRVEKWSSLISDMKVYEIEAFHNDMQNKENSKKISMKLNELFSNM